MNALEAAREVLSQIQGTHARVLYDLIVQHEKVTGALADRSEDLETAVIRFERAEGRIDAALAVMDRSFYGDPEVPFRMRAALTGALS